MQTVPFELDTDSTDDPWRQKYTRWWLQLRGLGWDAMMMDKIRRQNRIVRDNVRRIQGAETNDNGYVEDDMGLSIGDTVNHHHHYPNPSQPAPPPTAPPIPSQQPTASVPNWAKVAALLAGGAVTGGGITALVNYLNKENPPVESPKEQPKAKDVGLKPGKVNITVSDHVDGQ